ncbi:MAG: GNAT family N-acetyltransferase [Gemmatimonadales bacterium]|nr:GNAT family N-acetyltransferase [Gemmatimonadales bacterium]
MTTLGSPRLELRPAAHHHGTVLAGMATDSTGLADIQPRVDGIIASSLEWFSEHGFGLWVLHPAGQETPIGWAGLRPGSDPSTPELLYGLARDARGRGYATEASTAILAWLFERPRFTGAWAATTRDNPASRRVLGRLGMRLTGVEELDGVESLVYRVSRAEWLAKQNPA